MPKKSRKKSKGQAEKKAQAAATTSKAGGGLGAQQKAPGAATGSSQSKPAPAPGAAQTAAMKPTETKGTQAAKTDPAKTVAAKQPTASSASAPAAVKPKETTKKDKDVTGAVSASLKSSPKPPADKKAKVEESSGMSLDALDALGDTLGVAEVEPQAPKPLPKDIIQENLTSEKYKGRVGEREDSLPPNYRFGGTNKDTPIPKAKEEDKTPMDDMAALDALAGDFVSSATIPSVHSASAPSAATQKPQQKKDKDVTGAVSASLKSSPKPPADRKAKVEESSGMSLDALDALGDTLGVAEVEPQAPKLLPKDIIQENLTSEKYKGRVGEREDSLPPNYRFGGTNKDTPIPKAKEEHKTPMDDMAALDALAGDFVSSATSPSVHSAPTPSAATPKTQQGTQATKPDPAKTVAAKQQTVSSASAPAAVKPKETASSGMSLDALDALGDTLGVAEVEPQAPKLLPKDIIQENLTSEKYKGRVGEREDSLPPNYRFGGTNKDTPIPKAKEEDKTPMDDMAALDALAGDFVSSATSPNVHSAPTPSAATPKPQQTPMDNTSALDALAGDFVCPDVSPKVHSVAAPTSQPCAAAKPQNASRQESRGTTAALDALSDTLLPDELQPAPKPVPVSAVVKEALVTKETLERLGDRDDTLPPEYRFLVDKDKDKNGVKPKETPKETMGDSAALDALAGDFDSPAVAPTVQCTAAPTVQSSTARSQPVSRQESRGTTAALDALSDTLLPDELPPAPKPIPASAVVKDKTTDKRQPKLGEDENTIPDKYRFKDEKGKGGKDASKQVVKPKDPAQIDKEKGDALDALSMGFTSDSLPQRKTEDKKEVPSSTPAAAKPKTQSTDPSQPSKVHN
ncbi:calpastatin [Polyodon spathula]|uniref:calpastatin n=1 Tax=Polyodon spathula TaxID=7913 RepID=UPI001B7F1640|nr:calpastatin [Polyodon spathula]